MVMFYPSITSHATSNNLVSRLLVQVMSYYWVAHI